jgi:hypothetical protein
VSVSVWEIICCNSDEFMNLNEMSVRVWSVDVQILVVHVYVYVYV